MVTRIVSEERHAASLAIRRPKRGFTLIELLVSVGMLAVMVCGTVYAMVACLGLSTMSKHAHIANTAALGLAEEIQSASFPQIYDDYHGMNFVVNALPASMGFVNVDETNPDLLDITISVCWREGARSVGEDANLDGELTAEEDLDDDGIADSPVQLVMRKANR